MVALISLSWQPLPGLKSLYWGINCLPFFDSNSKHCGTAFLNNVIQSDAWGFNEAIGKSSWLQFYISYHFMGI
jgi:hypothetical protein